VFYAVQGGCGYRHFENNKAARVVEIERILGIEDVASLFESAVIVNRKFHQILQLQNLS